jgi:hypothetical protein
MTRTVVHRRSRRANQNGEGRNPSPLESAFEKNQFPTEIGKYLSTSGMWKFGTNAYKANMTTTAKISQPKKTPKRRKSESTSFAERQS